MKKNPGQPTSVSDILTSAFSSLKGEGFRVYPVWKNWKSIVGASVAGNTEPLFLEAKVLTVGVKHPVWITELTLQKKGILDAIRKAAPEAEVEDIRFKLLA